MTPDPAVVRFSQLWSLGGPYNYRCWVDVPRLRILPKSEDAGLGEYIRAVPVIESL